MVSRFYIILSEELSIFSVAFGGGGSEAGRRASRGRARRRRSDAEIPNEIHERGRAVVAGHAPTRNQAKQFKSGISQLLL